METKSALISDVLQVLGPLAEDNYEDWSFKVKTYLIAQDVWKIVHTFDKEPNPANGKVTFEDWGKKNAMALHVIQITCGPQAFSKIRKITSARDAWKTLAAKYKCGSKESTSTTKLDNSEITEDSSAKIASDSLGVENPEHPNSTSRINPEASSAKIASDSLGVENPEHPNSTCGINPGKDVNGNNGLVHMEIYNHVRSGNWIATNDLLELHTKVISSHITDMRKTVLQMAVFAGHWHIVKELVERMSTEDLKRKDKFGYTALAETTLLGNQQMAECMLTKNKDLISITSRSGLLPVVLAVFHRKLEFARYLYQHTPLASLQEKEGFNGVILIIQSMYTRKFDIALDLVRRDPSLAFAQDRDESSPLSVLASMRCAFKSGDPLVFWKEWIYKRINIEVATSLTTNETRLDIPEVERQKRNKVKNAAGSVLERLCHPAVSYLHELLGIQQLQETKWIHEHSRELLSVMCERISPFNVRKEKDVVSFAIFRAIKEGHHEFVKKVVDADPYVIWRRDKHGITVFQQAVLHRKAEIFRLLHEHDVRDSVMDLKDDFRNNVLHMAGKLPASIWSKHIQGAVLLMQRELQWFKELEKIVHPKTREERNESGLTPQELFTREHIGMKNEGEKWMKDTATSCTVVATFIVTIMFAAAFTVPGGNDQNTGLPTFRNEKLFMLFIVADALSLFSSSTSVLMFLGILTSRYEEEDFLISLPRKMIIGLSTLFLSIGTMMIAFSSALFLMLRGQSWIFPPVICFASVPVTLFGIMQFPLLVVMFKSTYVSRIFDPKIKYWS